MILVAVGDDDPPYPIYLIQQVTKIGDDQVNTQHVVFREHQPGVHDQDLPVVLQHHHIFADLTEAAQGDNFQEIL